jgi:putative lipoprotein
MIVDHRARARALALLALLIASLVGPRAARSEPPDPWLGRDKALHFSASAVIAAGGYGGSSLLTDDRRWRLVAGAGLAVAAGAGKEIADGYGYGDPSWRDFTWDLIGAATGVGIAWLLDRCSDRLSDRWGAAPRGPAPPAGDHPE